MLNRIIGIACVALLLATGFSANAQQDGTGTISISVKEYERLKELEEGDKKKQYWKMTFEQILERESNNYSKAWELYEFWVLRNIYLEGVVNSSSVGKIIDQISTLNKIDTKPITLRIRSGGGGVLDGMVLVNAMRNSAAPVNTICDSYAMSMAAVILAVGAHRHAGEGCIFMIHEVSVGAPGGQSTDHIKWTETVIDVEAQLVAMLSRRSGLDPQEIRTLMEYETFWDSEEAYRLGFVDSYDAGRAVAADRDIPDDLLPLNRMKRNFNENLTRR